MNTPNNSITSARYLGLVCSTHPDLAGLRQKANGHCIQCARDKTNAIKKVTRKGVSRIRVKSEAELESQRAYNRSPSRVAAIAFNNRVRQQHISAHASKDYGEFDQLLKVECYDLAKIRTRMLKVKWVVDHVVPLKGYGVSGLHIGCNLRVTTHKENQQKSNHFS